MTDQTQIRGSQGSFAEPEPVRTAAEILGCGFWSFSRSDSRLQVSDLGLKLLGWDFSSSAKPSGFDALFSPSDASKVVSHIESGLRFEYVAPSLAGYRVMLLGWPETGHRKWTVGVIVRAPLPLSDSADGSNTLLVEAIEAGIESMLVLHGVFGHGAEIVDFEIVELNSRAAQRIGKTRDESIGKLLTQLVPETRTNGVIDEYRAVMKDGRAREHEFHATPGGFQQIWVRQNIVPLSQGVAVFSTDVTQTRRQGESVDRARRMFERIAETTPDLLLLWDGPSRRLLYNNRTLEALAGRKEVKSMVDLAGLMIPDHRQKLDTHLQQALKAANDQVREDQFQVVGSDGAARHMLFRSSVFDRAEDGRVLTVLSTAQEITEQVNSNDKLVAKMEELSDAHSKLETQKEELEKLNLRLADLASTDALTGVKNRRAFQEKLEEEAERAQRYNSRLALLLADVDRFKIYNDTHGHPAGDLALKGFAQVLTEVCRKSDTIARFGGEEFAVLLPNTGAEEAARLAERIRASLSGTLIGRQGVTASFGCAEFASGKEGKDKLVNDADKALYESKNGGRDRVTIHREG